MEELTQEELIYYEERCEIRPCGHPAWYDDEE